MFEKYLAFKIYIAIMIITINCSSSSWLSTCSLLSTLLYKSASSQPYVQQVQIQIQIQIQTQIQTCSKSAICSAGSKGGRRWGNNFNNRLFKILIKVFCKTPHLEEEVLDRGGDGIDGDVEAVEVDVCVLIKLLEEQVHVGTIPRHPGQSWL